MDEPIEELVHHAFAEYWPEERGHLAKAAATVQGAAKGVEDKTAEVVTTLKKKIA